MTNKQEQVAVRWESQAPKNDGQHQEIKQNLEQTLKASDIDTASFNDVIDHVVKNDALANKNKETFDKKTGGKEQLFSKLEETMEQVAQTIQTMKEMAERKIEDIDSKQLMYINSRLQRFDIQRQSLSFVEKMGQYPLKDSEDGSLEQAKRLIATMIDELNKAKKELIDELNAKAERVAEIISTTSDSVERAKFIAKAHEYLNKLAPLTSLEGDVNNQLAASSQGEAFIGDEAEKSLVDAISSVQEIASGQY